MNEYHHPTTRFGRTIVTDTLCGPYVSGTEIDVNGVRHDDVLLMTKDEADAELRDLIEVERESFEEAKANDLFGDFEPDDQFDEDSIDTRVAYVCVHPNGDVEEWDHENNVSWGINLNRSNR